MSDWWDPQSSGMIGGLLGAAAGVFGGLLGAAIGVLAPRGKCKRLIIGAQVSAVAVGVAALVAGVAAVVMGQPYHVYYPLLLAGFILTVVMGAMLPVTLKRYRQADQRRLNAEELRRG